MAEQILDALKQFGPAFLALAIAYYRDKAVEARNKQRIAELEKKIMENKQNVEKENSGLSSDAVIDKYTSGSGS